MKKLIFVILALITFAPLVSWGIKKKKKPANNSPIVSVLMHRTACYGRCPDYTIELNKDGNATYTGIRFVKDSGVYKKNIGSAQTMSVINKLLENHVDTCTDKYINRIPDLPGIVYTITYKDSVKKIFNANWGPQYLKDIATDMDNVGKPTGKTWKKVKATKTMKK